MEYTERKSTLTRLMPEINLDGTFYQCGGTTSRPSVLGQCNKIKLSSCCVLLGCENCYTKTGLNLACNFSLHCTVCYFLVESSQTLVTSRYFMKN